MFFANVRIDNRILFCLISLFASALKNEWLGRTTAKSKTSLHARLNIPISKSKKIQQDKASVILFANVVFYAKLSDHAMFSTDWRTKGQLCNSTVRQHHAIWVLHRATCHFRLYFQLIVQRQILVKFLIMRPNGAKITTCIAAADCLQQGLFSREQLL